MIKGDEHLPFRSDGQETSGLPFSLKTFQSYQHCWRAIMKGCNETPYPARKISVFSGSRIRDL